MTGRVPDAAGWWFADCDSPRPITGPDPVCVFVHEIAPKRFWFRIDCEDWREVGPVMSLQGRWLGPVAPPCPKGRVRVEMSRDAAETAKGRAFAAVCQWQANGGYGLQIAKEIHEALRTALAKGAA